MQLCERSLCTSRRVACETCSGYSSLCHKSDTTLPRARALRSIAVTFIDRDGERITVRAPVGQNLLEVAHAKNVDLEVSVTWLALWLSPVLTSRCLLVPMSGRV